MDIVALLEVLVKVYLTVTSLHHIAKVGRNN